MDILLLSRDDSCRSRIAAALLGSFGRGIKYHTAGLSPTVAVSDRLVSLAREWGLELSIQHPADLADFVGRPWDCVVTLCPEVERIVKDIPIQASYYQAFDFADLIPALQREPVDTEGLEAQYEVMRRQLYRFYRDILVDWVMPLCTCGANTYCRCE